MGRMARPVKITPVKHQSGLWMIRIPARLEATGKRKSEFYKTQKEANDRVREVKQIAEGMRDRERLMTPAEHEEIVDELARLLPFGVSLSEVIDYYVERHRSKEAKLVSVIAPIYLAGIGEKSTQYRTRVRQVLARFCQDFGDLMLDDVTADMFEDWLAAWKPTASAYNSVMRHIKPFFAWAIRKEFALKSPAGGVSQRKQQSGPIAILSAGQAREVIAACRSHVSNDGLPGDLRLDASDALTAIAIMLFAGIRPHEMSLLDWEHVKLEHGYIRVEPEVSKTNSVRLVKIEENLRQWLDLVPLSKRHGRIVPRNWNRKWKAIRKVAGIQDMQDVCRHSYASYWLTKYRDTHGLLENMGHTTSRTTIKYYLTACDPVDVPLYWSIVPAKNN